MIVMTNGQMKAAERRGMEELGVSSLILMENAALNVVNYVKENFRNKYCVIFCGKGNNGGDGYAIARGLFSRGAAVSVVSCGDPEKGTPDCLINYKSVKAMGIDIRRDFERAAAEADIIIDAVIGTGLSRELNGETGEICRAINKSCAYKIAVDCPTGVNSDSGEVYENAVKADLTFTFHCPKTGLLLFPARDFVGELKVGSIGIPVKTCEGLSVTTLTDKDAAALIPKRSKNSSKLSFGRVFAFSGSDSMTGAAVLNIKSAYLGGAGLVYGVCTQKTADIIHTKVIEAVVKIMPQQEGCLTVDAYRRLKDSLRDENTVLIGSGLGVTQGTKELVKEIIKNFKGNIVIDADGINSLTNSAYILTETEAGTVLTPHMSEMSRLTGISAEKLRREPIKAAASFAKKYGSVIMLKDASTVIASPDGRVCINTVGSPAMAKGGSGDVLAGLTAGFAAQGVELFSACCLSAYICGKAGELSEKTQGAWGAMPERTAENIPVIMKSLTEGRPI